MTERSGRTFIAVVVFLLTSCALPVANAVNERAATSTPAPASAAKLNANNAPQPVVDPTPEKVEQVNLDPVRLTQDFYEYYLDGFPSIDDNRVVYIQYLTSALFDRALSGEVDPYDPFFDAEDNDPTWKGNVTVGKAAITGNKATVDVKLNGQRYKWTIQVRLLKKGSVWKIDGAKNLTVK